MLLLLLSFVLHRGYATRTKSPSKDEIVEQREGNGVIDQITGVLALIALLASLIYIAFPHRIAWASFSLPVWARWAGIPIAVLGFGLIENAQGALGANWSDTPVLTKGQTLSTEGPYKWLRHPIYSAFLLILSAPLLLSSNWLLGFAWILMTSLDVNSRANFEEGILLTRFGDKYQRYMKETGRFLPRIA